MRNIPHTAAFGFANSRGPVLHVEWPQTPQRPRRSTLRRLLMNTLVSRFEGAVAAPAPAPARKHRVSDLTMYLLLGALVLGAWAFTRMGYFRSGDDVGYWLGVSGGVMMLLLLLYPVRKYFKFTHRWGKVKWWFLVHMLLGIGGPLLILVHSTFHLGSVNAAVALFSMLIVAGSGIIGRFLYLRIHSGLHGEKNNLVVLQRRVGLAEGEIQSRFRFAPEVAAHLMKFESEALAGKPGLANAVRRVAWLPMRQRIVYRACMVELDQRLRLVAKEREWSRGQFRRRRDKVHSTARNYLRSVTRVAQLSAYERLFALWHVLHAPFVYLLALTAGFHVFAVHAY